MAYPLVSPGVDVTVIDESFYGSAGEGTVPLIIIGTHKYKTHPNGQEIALGTLPENSNKLYLITSQRELIQTFGNPVFYSKGGASRHAYELNEFGLHAAYQYLGIANRAFVIAGNIDYAQLFPRLTAPRGEPLGGTYWLDTKASAWGVFESNGGNVPGSAWNARTPIVIDQQVETEFYILSNLKIAEPMEALLESAGVLNINNRDVALARGDSLAAVVEKVNAAGIPSVSASLFQLAGNSKFMLRNTLSGGNIVVGNASSASVLQALGISGGQSSFYAPKATIGVDGDFAMVVTSTNDNELYQKIKAQGIKNINDPLSSSFWFKVGSADWKAATPTRATGRNRAILMDLAGQSFTVATSSDPAAAISIVFEEAPADLAALIAKVNANIETTRYKGILTATANGTAFEMVNALGEDLIIAAQGNILDILGLPTLVRGNRLVYSPHYNVPAGSSAGDVWIKTTEFNNGANWSLKVFNATTGTWVTITAPLLSDDVAANALFGSKRPIGAIYIQTNVLGTPSNPVASHEMRRWNGVAWESLVYNYGEIEPTTEPEEGTLWFNDNFRVDIMINDGDQWKGYKNYPGNVGTDISGPILAGSAPLSQLNGNPLAQNDLWINTSDLENYPKMYRYQAVTRTWELINTKDNTTPFGVVFADARNNADGSEFGPEDAPSMLFSDYVDPDAPDARTYPDGILLFNMRYSTNNVKEWRPNYFLNEYAGTDFTMEAYNVGASQFGPVASSGRWVTVSGKAENGVPFMGRKAQRAMIVRSLASTIAGNEDVRAETINFNLLAAPGYIELVDEMVSLNVDKKEVAFIVADTPARLDPSGTSILKFANAELSSVSSNSEDGATTFNPYVGMYYPWGLGTNVDGFEVMIPPSTIALRTIAYNDSVAYPWMAPAGYTRGLVTNATSVGYLTKEGEFKAVMLSGGQRDVLYANRINPIAYQPQRGLVVFGQKTRHNLDTAMDRINVARLINYLRYNLDIISKPFLFEPNDFHTRDAVRIVFERFLGNLVGLRAMYDFIVVCDESNNTPDRIDRNELWVDVAIQPEKAIEFIYIPIRIVNTGEDMQSLYAPRNLI